MKKSLLALSVLAAFAGVAHAQSAVTVYGVVDMAIQHQNHDGAITKSKTALDSGIQSGSRLGFKGTEDLGNNLKANFLLEMGILADTGKSQGDLTFGRQAYVGLSGDFGAVNLGRQYAPIFIAVDTIDPWDAGFIGGKAGEGTSSGGILTVFETPFRTDNTINYTTNNLGGFTGSAAYTFGEKAGGSSVSRQMGLSGTYAAGPVTATLAYHRANDVVIAGNDKKSAFLGGIYDFGVAKLHAAIGRTTSDLDTSDHKDWMIGTTVPFGAAALLASYTRIDNKVPGAVGKSNQIAVGGTYSLSKRTNLYTSFSRTDNDANVNVAGLAAANGATDRLFNVGVRHKF